jgi:hypothetical protein
MHRNMRSAADLHTAVFDRQVPTGNRDPAIPGALPLPRIRDYGKVKALAQGRDFKKTDPYDFRAYFGPVRHR